MGCEHSKQEKTTRRAFGETGVHVGRHGDVNLTSRSLEVFGTKFIELIKHDKLHDAKRLHLSDNKLYTLGKEMMLLPDIEELYINGNRFQRVPEVLKHMPKLRCLDVSYNSLGLHNYAFGVLPRIECLTHVVLRRCEITNIPLCIVDCAVLEILDLSDNPNLQLRDAPLSKLPALHTLLIADCGITGGIPIGVKEIQTLQSLDISGNSWVFETVDFFGKWMPKKLSELHLRALHLSAVPQVVTLLRSLTYLDIAENPIETLDVLAGRFVRRVMQHNDNGSAERLASDKNDGVLRSPSSVSESTRINSSQSSRAEKFVLVAQPMPLKRLCLRACGLYTVPKYFHKLTTLINIDLSENEHLDEDFLTFFSFPDLQVLNVVGCPFANNTEVSSNVWLDIGKLRKLHTLNWDLWKEARNVSPYRTRIPVEICGLPLREVNGVKLRPNLFVKDTVQTVINLLVDGYFKVDFSMDDNLVYSHAEALRALHPLESFFFITKVIADGTEQRKIVPEVLQICINRYIFFLTLQAANYNVLIIPPADVMAIHYAQMTQHPAFYRKDCEAICGQVLNCNYRFFFFDRKLRPSSVNKALVGSKRVWNRMVRASQQDIRWLRYDFWDKRGGGTHSFSDLNIIQKVLKGSALTTLNNASVSSVAGGPAAPPPSALESITDLGTIDSVRDLRTVLDHSITSYFADQGIKIFEDSLESFFNANRVFMKYEKTIINQSIDWTRYVKYFTLVAYVHRMKRSHDKSLLSPLGNNSISLDMPANNSTHDDYFYLPRPRSNSFHAPPRPAFGTRIRATKSEIVKAPAPPRRRPSLLVALRALRSGGHAAITDLDESVLHTNPVPTIGLRLLLDSHRTTHAKYYQLLMLLGIGNNDIEYENCAKDVEATLKLWEALYNERYVVKSSMGVCFDDLEFETPAPSPHQGAELNVNTVLPLQSAMKKGNTKKHCHVKLSFCLAQPEKISLPNS